MDRDREDDSLKYVTALEPPDFRRVMEAYSEDIWNYAYFLSKKRELADDLAQETFVKAFKQLGSYRGEASVKTWLIAITRNTWYSYRKTAFIRKVALVGFLPSKGAAVSAETEYMRRAYSDEVWEVVLALPLKYREALILQAHYHMSVEEIATMLGIRATAVKSRLRRAKERAGMLMKERRARDEEDRV